MKMNNYIKLYPPYIPPVSPIHFLPPSGNHLVPAPGILSRSKQLIISVGQSLCSALAPDLHDPWSWVADPQVDL